MIILIVVVIVYDYINGMNDSGNIVAAMVSSRSMSLGSALFLAAVFEFAGPFIVGTAVAKTIGSGLVDPSVINLNILYAAVLGAISWNIITQVLGYPSSSSHALLGGITGAVAISVGIKAINYSEVVKILGVLLVSPLLGFLINFLVMKLLFYLGKNATPKANKVFKYMQVPASMFLALSHGGNDAQKSMGIIVIGLIICGTQSVFLIPLWVMILCSLALALGVFTGGMRVMKTLGSKVFKVQPVHGFGIQISSALVIFSAALIGSPVSTTHVVSSSIVGAGSSAGINRVRWGVVTDILLSWFLTVPFSGLIAILFYYGIMYINP
ncbi:MAG: inorganic phosphate transporter [Candidatus Firestonebacteria bacterium]|nr:inorganic phosphate transporter [Candidatus Firestonebacteria bacterium]